MGRVTKKALAQIERDMTQGPTHEPGSDLVPHGEVQDGVKGTARPEPGQAKRYALEKPWVRGKLIRDLAIGEMTQDALGIRYGVSRKSITEFKKRHDAEVESVRSQIDDEYAGEWIANKLDRLRVYQEAAERMAEGRSPRNAEVLVNILKGAAEELGQLPARTQVQVNTQNVEYKVYGINPDDLT